MPSCPNGHSQPLGLKCTVCGEPLSYKGALEELAKLPEVTPDYGRVSVLTVGYPGISPRADYVGAISAGPADLRTSSAFQVAGIRGGTWLDYQKAFLVGLRRWMKLVGIDKATDRFLVVDTTDPLSVLALSALPKIERTAVVAVAADQDSTPVEQNTSYVALSLALKKGLPIVALSETFDKEMLYFTEESGFVTGVDAMSRMLDPLITAADDLMDMLERDLKLGVKMHSMSTIMAGSKEVYGTATNAYLAQSYNFSLGVPPDEYQTVHSMVFARKETKSEFEKSFGVYRNRKFKGALSAELRFRETDSPMYDMMTFYGLKGDASLQSIASGYQAIVGSMPELSADGVS
jgi:hypothetical protein